MASPLSTSPKRKRIYLYAGIEKFDFECAVFHFSFLANQLVQAVFLHHPLALCVGVYAVVFAWRGAVYANAKPHRLAIFAGSQNQMQVPRMKAEEHLSRGGYQRRVLIAHSPVSSESPLIDGQAPGSAHGEDVDGQGIGTIIKPRLYQLIRQPNPIAERRFEIEFLDPGVEVFDFTFG